MNIALLGAQGAGKDTVADILVAHHGYTHLKFADPLREFVEAIDPAFRAAVRCGYEHAKRNDPFVRQRLIEVGNAARRIIHPDVWIIALNNQLANHPVVVSDVRFHNEIEFLQLSGFGLIHVTRPGYESDDYPQVKQALNLDNTGTVDDLTVRVSALLDTHKGE